MWIGSALPHRVDRRKVNVVSPLPSRPHIVDHGNYTLLKVKITACAGLDLNPQSFARTGFSRTTSTAGARRLLTVDSPVRYVDILRGNMNNKNKSTNSKNSEKSHEESDGNDGTDNNNNKNIEQNMSYRMELSWIIRMVIQIKQHGQNNENFNKITANQMIHSNDIIK